MHAEQFGVFKWACSSSSETKGPNAWIGCKLSSKAGVPARTRHSFLILQTFGAIQVLQRFRGDMAGGLRVPTIR